MPNAFTFAGYALIYCMYVWWCVRVSRCVCKLQMECILHFTCAFSAIVLVDLMSMYALLVWFFSFAAVQVGCLLFVHKRRRYSQSEIEKVQIKTSTVFVCCHRHLTTNHEISKHDFLTRIYEKDFSPQVFCLVQFKTLIQKTALYARFFFRIQNFHNLFLCVCVTFQYLLNWCQRNNVRINRFD